MADVTLTTIDALMKELYKGQKPSLMAAVNKPLLQWMPKRSGFVGDVFPVPLTYAHGSGRSGTFVDAQSDTRGTQNTKWLMTRASDYAVVTIDAETMKASKNNLGAFARARKHEVDAKLDQLGRSAHQALYGNGFGGLGTIATSGITGEVITLTNAEDTRNFNPGMQIEAMTSIVAAAMRVGDAEVESIQHEDGTITLVTGGVAAIAALAAGDVLLQMGDADTTTANKMIGLAGWLPLTAPSSTAFFGVDRTVESVRLGGNRLDNTSATIEENLFTLIENMAAFGANPDTVFLSHGNYAEFVKNLTVPVERSPGGTGVTGFSSIKVHTSAGVVEVIPDVGCPSNRGYVLQKDTWKLFHLEQFPHIVQDDGLMALRQANSDGIEIRMRYWGNPYCTFPGKNGVFSI